MNDLDTQMLRRALRAPQEPGYSAPGHPGPAEVAKIITRGRRLRWRRRAMAAGGSVCLAAAVVGAVVGIGRLTTPSSGPAQHVVSPVGPTRTKLAPSPSHGRGRAAPSPLPSATAVPTTSPTPTATPSPTRTQALPTPTLSAGVAVSASNGYSATSIPSASASAASTSGEQPSPTPTAAG